MKKTTRILSLLGIGIIPLMVGGTATGVAMSYKAMAGTLIVQEDLSTYIDISTLGQFNSTPTRANAIARVYTNTSTHIRLITSEVLTTIDNSAQTVTFTAATGSKFYSNSITLPYTLKVNYVIATAFGAIPSNDFGAQTPTPEQVLAYMATQAANSAQVDIGQMRAVINALPGPGDYEAVVTAQPYATWYDPSTDPGYTWNFTASDTRVDISTIIAVGDDLGSFVGAPTEYQIMNNIWSTYGTSLISKDYVQITGITVTGTGADNGSATLTGVGFLKNSTTVKFTSTPAPDIATLLSTTRDATPTTNTWYSDVSDPAIIGSLTSKNDISGLGLVWDCSQLSLLNKVINPTTGAGTATVVVNADSTLYEPGSQCAITFTVNVAKTLDSLFITGDKLLTFETDPAALTIQQQIYAITESIAKCAVVNDQINYDNFVAHEFIPSCVTITWTNSAIPYQFTIAMTAAAYEFTGSSTFYYGLY